MKKQTMKPENDMTNGSNAPSRHARSAARRVRRERLKRGFTYFILQTFILAYTPHAYAGPEGGEIVRGNGTITMPDDATTIINQNTGRIVIDWDSFNIGANESVIFNQPSATAAALNRIFDQLPSEIFGSLQANGQVFLINPYGIVFGEGSQVNVGGLLATSMNISPDDFMDGDWTFRLGDSEGVILNAGSITAAPGGFVTLAGAGVDNQGLILADFASVTLASGDAMIVDFDGTGAMRFRMDGAAAQSSGVSNSGTIQANGGAVLLQADVVDGILADAVNMSGVITAGAIDSSGGGVRLIGSGGDVNVTGMIDASGVNGNGADVDIYGESVSITGDAFVTTDGGGNGSAGDIMAIAQDTMTFSAEMSARGGDDGGNGGFVEVSGYQHLSFSGFVDRRAPNGENGMLLLDPGTIGICVEDAGATCGDVPDEISDVTISTNLTGGDVTLDTSTATATVGAAEDINVIQTGVSIALDDTNTLFLNAGTSIDLADATFTETATGSLELNFGQLNAGGTLDLSDVSITASSVTIDGGTDTANNIIIGATAGSAFAISGTNIGDVDGFGFTDVGSLTGGAADDTFTVNGGTLSGAISGGEGSETSGDTITFVGVAQTFTIDSVDGASTGVASVTGGFSNVENYVGADNFNDLITIGSSGGLSGTLDLGSGATNDVLFLSDDGNAVTIEGTGTGRTGDLNGGAAGGFSDVEQLFTGGGSDTVDFDAGATFLDVITGAGNDTVNLDQALNGALSTGFDSDTVNVDVGGSATSIDLGAAGGTTNDDTITAQDGGVAIVISGTGAGTVGGQAFTNAENVIGGAGSDTISTSGAATIDIDGGDGTDTITLTQAITGAVTGGGDADTINLDVGGSATSISGGTTAGAGSDDDTITAPDAVQTITITGTGTGTIGAQGYADFENVTGGSLADTFEFDAAATVDVDGGAGADVFNLDQNVTGSIDGGTGADTFFMNDGVQLSATSTIDGSLGGDDGATDTISWANNSLGPVVVLSGAGTDVGVAGTETGLTAGASFDNIDNIVGSAVTTDSLTGIPGNGASEVNWVIDGADSGTISDDASGQSATFGGFNNLIGGDGTNDDFYITTDAFTGTIGGGTAGTQNDYLTFASPGGSEFTTTSTSSGDLEINGAGVDVTVSDIEEFYGSDLTVEIINLDHAVAYVDLGWDVLGDTDSLSNAGDTIVIGASDLDFGGADIYFDSDMVLNPNNSTLISTGGRLEFDSASQIGSDLNPILTDVDMLAISNSAGATVDIRQIMGIEGGIELDLILDGLDMAGGDLDLNVSEGAIRPNGNAIKADTVDLSALDGIGDDGTNDGALDLQDVATLNVATTNGGIYIDVNSGSGSADLSVQSAVITNGGSVFGGSDISINAAFGAVSLDGDVFTNGGSVSVSAYGGVAVGGGVSIGSSGSRVGAFTANASGSSAYVNIGSGAQIYTDGGAVTLTAQNSSGNGGSISIGNGVDIFTQGGAVTLDVAGGFSGGSGGTITVGTGVQFGSDLERIGSFTADVSGSSSGGGSVSIGASTEIWTNGGDVDFSASGSNGGSITIGDNVDVFTLTGDVNLDAGASSGDGGVITVGTGVQFGSDLERIGSFSADVSGRSSSGGSVSIGASTQIFTNGGSVDLNASGSFGADGGSITIGNNVDIFTQSGDVNLYASGDSGDGGVITVGTGVQFGSDLERIGSFSADAAGDGSGAIGGSVSIGANTQIWTDGGDADFDAGGSSDADSGLITIGNDVDIFTSGGSVNLDVGGGFSSGSGGTVTVGTGVRFGSASSRIGGFSADAAGGSGNGGNVNIGANTQIWTDGGDVDIDVSGNSASSSGFGNGGTITIGDNVGIFTQSGSSNGSVELNAGGSASGGSGGNGGSITVGTGVQFGSVSSRIGSFSADASGLNGGSVSIGANTQIFTTSSGFSGAVVIDVGGSASSGGAGNGGSITIGNDVEIFTQGGDVALDAAGWVSSGSGGNGGAITVGTGVQFGSDGSRIGSFTADASGSGSSANGGSVSIGANTQIFTTSGSGSIAVAIDVGASSGSGGSITIGNDVDIFTQGGAVSLDASGSFGGGGSITVGTGVQFGSVSSRIGSFSAYGGSGGIDIGTGLDIFTDGGDVLFDAAGFSGGGSIDIGANADIVTSGGSVSMDAGRDISIGTGAQIDLRDSLGTSPGGFSAHAGSGSGSGGDFTLGASADIFTSSEAVTIDADGSFGGGGQITISGDITTNGGSVSLTATSSSASSSFVDAGIAVNGSILTDGGNFTASATATSAANASAGFTLGSTGVIDTGDGASSGGDVTIIVGAANAGTMNADITLNGDIFTSGGNFTASANLGSAGGGNATVTLNSGAIVDVTNASSGGNVNITADAGPASGSGTIYIGTDLVTGGGSVDLVTSGSSGGITIAGGVLINTQGSGSGGFTADASGGSFSMGAGSQINAGSDQISITADGGIEVENLTTTYGGTGAAVGLYAINGSVTGNAGVLEHVTATAGELEIDAGSGGVHGAMGSSTAIMTSVNALDIYASSGALYVHNTGGVTVVEFGNSNSDAVTLVTDTGDISMPGTTTEVYSLGGGDISLTATAGSILDGAVDDGATNDVDVSTTGAVTLVAGGVAGTIGALGDIVEMSGTSDLTATATATYLGNDTDLLFYDQTVTGDGTVSITGPSTNVDIVTAGGITTVNNITNGADMDVDIDTTGNTPGDVLIGDTADGGGIQAGTGTVVIAAAGSIEATSPGTENNVTAGNLTLSGVGGVGNDGTLQTAVTTLDVTNATSGAIDIHNTGGVALDDLTADGTAVTNTGDGGTMITAGSPLTVNSAVVDSGGGDIVLAAEGTAATDDLTINADVTASGGTGSIFLYAGDSITQAAGTTISAESTGGITARAGVDFTGAVEAVGLAGGLSNFSQASTAVIASQDGDIDVSATLDVTIGTLDADSDDDLAFGDVYISAGDNTFGNGDLTGTGDLMNATGSTATPNVTADNLQVRTTGTSGWPGNGPTTIHLDVTSLDAVIGGDFASFTAVADTNGDGVTVDQLVINGTGGAVANDQGFYLNGGAGDLIIAGTVSTEGAASLVAGGSIVDGGGSITATTGLFTGGVYLRASGATGSVGTLADPIEVTSPELVAHAVGGDIAVNVTGDTAIDSFFAPGQGVVSGVDITGNVGGDIQIVASGALDVNQAVSGDGTLGGSITLQALDGDLTFAAAGDVTAAAANAGTVTLTAIDSGSGFGSVVMTDGALVNAGAGDIDVDADDDVDLGGLLTTSATATAVTIDAGGAVTDNGDAHTDVVANSGTAVINAGTGIGDGNALETSIGTLDANTAAAGNLAIIETDALSVAEANAAAGTVNIANSAGDITLTGATTAATTVDYTATGSLIDGNDGSTLISATTLTVNAGTGIGSGQGAAAIDTTVANIDLNTVTGSIGIAETDGLILQGLEVTGVTAGTVDVVAGGQMSLSDTAADNDGTVVESTSTGLMTFDVNGGQRLYVDRSISHAGALTLAADHDIDMDNSAATTIVASGDVTITADADGNVSGSFIMTDGNTVDAGAGDFDVDGVRILIGGLTTTGDVVIDALLDVEDRGDADVDIVADDVTINAVTGIGTAGAFAGLETTATTLILNNSTSGNVAVNETDAVTLIEGSHAGIGTFTVTAGGSITVDDSTAGNDGVAINSTATGLLTLDAGAGATASDITLNDGIVTGGAVSILADDSITAGVDGDVTGNGAMIIRADADADNTNADDGEAITMGNGTVFNAGGGDVDVDAVGNVALGSLITTSGSATAVDVATSTGAVSDANGDIAGDNVTATTGELTITAATGIGAGNALETTVQAVDLTSTAGAVEVAETNGLFVNQASSAGAIDIDAGTGDLALLGTVTSSASTVDLTAGNSIIDGADGSTLITGTTVTLDAGLNAGVAGTGDLDTDADNLDLNATAGSVVVDETDAVTIDASSSGTSTFISNQAGDITLAGAVTATTTADLIAFGALVDGNDGATTVSGTAVTLTADTGIGSVGAGGEIETAATTLDLFTDTGDIAIIESDSVTVTDATIFTGGAGDDLYVETVNGHMTLDNTNSGNVVTVNGGGDIDLIAGTNGTGTNSYSLFINDGIAGSGGTLTMESETDVIIGNGQVDADIDSGDGDIFITADSNNTDVGLAGGLLQGNGNTMNAGAGIIDVQAHGDILIANLRSTAAGDAITVSSEAGAITDNGDSHLDIDATNGQFTADAFTGIGSGNSLDTFVLELDLGNASSGDVDVNNTGGAVTVVEIDQAGGGAVSVEANGDITVDNAGAEAITIAGGGLLTLETTTLSDGSIIINDGISTDGAVTFVAEDDILFAQDDSDVTGTGAAANFSFTADSDGDANGSGGEFFMFDGTTDGGSIIDAGAGGGGVTISADEDVTLASVQATGVGAFVDIDTTSGAVVDGGDTSVDLVVDAGSVYIDAVNGIGDLGGNEQLETTIFSLEAVTTGAAGGIGIDESTGLIVARADVTNAGNSDEIRINSGTMLITDSNNTVDTTVITHSGTGDILLTADALGSADIDLYDGIVGNANVVLDAYDSVTANTSGGDITANGAGSISVTADADANSAGNNNGEVVNMLFSGNDGSIWDAGTGTIDVYAIGNVTLTSLETASATGVADVYVESVNGSIVDGGDADTDVDAAGGQLVLIADIDASGTGGDVGVLGGNALDTEVASIDVTAGNDVHIDEFDGIVVDFGDIGNGTGTGSLDLGTSNAGDITDATNVTFDVAGNADFNADSGSGSIDLGDDGIGNDTVTFGSFEAVGFDVSLIESAGGSAQGTLFSGTTTVGNDLFVLSDGDITDDATSSIDVTGDATLAVVDTTATTGQDIVLGTTPTDHVAFGRLNVTADAVVLNEENSGTEYFGVNLVTTDLSSLAGGAITDSNTTTIDVGDNAYFNAGGGTFAVTLGDDDANDVTDFGNLSVVGNDVTINEDSATVFENADFDASTSSVTGNLDLTADGTITDTDLDSTLVVTGTTDLDTDAAGSEIRLDNAANDFGGVVTFNSVVGSIDFATFNDVDDITFGDGIADLTINTQLSVHAGGLVTQTAGSDLLGNFDLGVIETASAGVLLDEAGNDFNRVAISTNGFVSLQDVNDITVDRLNNASGVTVDGVSYGTGNVAMTDLVGIANTLVTGTAGVDIYTPNGAILIRDNVLADGTDDINLTADTEVRLETNAGDGVVVATVDGDINVNVANGALVLEDEADPVIGALTASGLGNIDVVADDLVIEANDATGAYQIVAGGDVDIRPNVGLTMGMGDDAVNFAVSDFEIADSEMDEISSNTVLTFGDAFTGRILLDRVLEYTESTVNLVTSSTVDDVNVGLALDNGATTNGLQITAGDEIGSGSAAPLYVDVDSVLVNSSGGQDVSILNDATTNNANWSITTGGGGTGDIYLVQTNNDFVLSDLSTTDNLYIEATVGSVTDTIPTGTTISVGQNAEFVAGTDVIIGDIDALDSTNFGTLTVTAGNDVNINEDSATTLAAGFFNPPATATGANVGGDFTLTSDGQIDQTAQILVTGDSVVNSVTDEDIIFDDITNDFVGMVSADGNDVEIQDANDLILGNINATANGFGTGTLTAQTQNGTITDGTDVVMDSDGVTTFTAGGPSDITLGDDAADNLKFGTLVVDGDNVTITENEGMVIDHLIAATDATLTANGSITDVAIAATTTVQVGGIATLDAGTNAITLGDDDANDVTNFGSLGLVAGNVNIREDSSTTFNDVAVNQLVVQSDGAMDQTAATTITTAATSTLTAVDGASTFYDITLANAGNDFGGRVNSSGVNVTFQDDVGGFIVGTTDTNGNLVIVSTDGEITDNASGVLDVEGTTDLTAWDGAATYYDVTVNRATNDFTGAVTSTGDNVNIRDANDLLIGTTIADSNLTLVAAGTILDNGTTVDVGGDTVLTAFDGANFYDIYLNVGFDPLTLIGVGTGNDFVGSVTATGDNISITDDNDLLLGNLFADGWVDLRVSWDGLTGGITDVAGASISVLNGQAYMSAIDSITLGDNVADNTNFGSVDLWSVTADVTVSEDSQMQIDNLTAGGNATLVANGNIDDTSGAVVNVGGLADFNAANGIANVTLGDNDGADLTTFGSLSLTALTASINEDAGGSATGTALDQVAVTTLNLQSDQAITDTLTSSVVVTGVATILANDGVTDYDITLGGATDTTNFGSLNAVGANISVAEDSSMNLINLVASGDATMEAAGNIVDASNTVVSVTGAASFDALSNSVTLGDTGGDSTNFGSLSLHGTSATVTEDSDTVLDSVSFEAGNTTQMNTLTLTSAGSITDSGAEDVLVATANLVANGGASLIALDTATNDFGTVNSSGSDTTFVDANSINLGTVDANGFLNVTALGGDITDSVDVNVTGQTDLSATGDIILDEAGNDFDDDDTGDDVNSSATNTTLVDEDDIDLGITTTTGTLDVTAGGNITDDAAATATVAGDATLVAGGDIVLDAVTNDFQADVYSDSVNTTLVDANSIQLNTTTATGDLTVTALAGDVTDTGGPLAIAGTATVDASGDVTLGDDTTFNAGSLDVGATNVAITEASAMDITDLDATGTATLNAAGDITDSGGTGGTADLTVGGLLTLDANTNNIELDDANNDFNDVTASDSNDLTVNDANDIILQAVTITGDEVVTAGATVTVNAAQDAASIDLNGTFVDVSATLTSNVDGITLTGDATGVSVDAAVDSATFVDINSLNGVVDTTATIDAVDDVTVDATDINIGGAVTTTVGGISLTATTLDVDVTAALDSASTVDISALAGTANVAATIDSAGTTTVDAGDINVDAAITATNAGGITLNAVTSDVDVNAPLTASGAVDIDAVGAVNVSSTIVAPADITIDSDGLTTVNAGGIITGTLGGSIIFGADRVGGLDVSDQLSTTSGNVTFNNDVNLSVDYNPTSATGSIAFLGDVTGAQALDIDAGIGNASLLGDALSLTSFDVSNATDVLITSNVDTTGAATINNIGVFTLDGGSILSDGAFTLTGATAVELGGTIQTAGQAIDFSAPITLIDTSVIDSSDAGGAATGADITFQSTIDGNEDLTLNAGTGGILTFDADVGEDDALASMTIDAGTIVAPVNLTTEDSFVVQSGDFEITAGTGTAISGDVIDLQSGIYGDGLLSLQSGTGIDIEVSSVGGSASALVLDPTQFNGYMGTLTIGADNLNGIDDHLTPTSDTVSIISDIEGGSILQIFAADTVAIQGGNVMAPVVILGFSSLDGAIINPDGILGATIYGDVITMVAPSTIGAAPGQEINLESYSGGTGQLEILGNAPQIFANITNLELAQFRSDMIYAENIEARLGLSGLRVRSSVLNAAILTALDAMTAPRNLDGDYSILIDIRLLEIIEAMQDQYRTWSVNWNTNNDFDAEAAADDALCMPADQAEERSEAGDDGKDKSCG